MILRPHSSEKTWVISREWVGGCVGAWVTQHTPTSGRTEKTISGSVTGLSLSPGDGSPKPLKGLGSNPDLELLLRSSQPGEDEYEEEEEYFVAQRQQ